MLCLELYADKTRLSSFGTEQGYPVMARIVNLPVEIRNSNGIGGAQVVGWLPVVHLKHLYHIQTDLELQPRSVVLRRTKVDPVGLISNG